MQAARLYPIEAIRHECTSQSTMNVLEAHDLAKSYRGGDGGTITRSRRRRSQRRAR